MPQYSGINEYTQQLLKEHETLVTEMIDTYKELAKREEEYKKFAEDRQYELQRQGHYNLEDLQEIEKQIEECNDQIRYYNSLESNFANLKHIIYELYEQLKESNYKDIKIAISNAEQEYIKDDYNEMLSKKDREDVTKLRQAYKDDNKEVISQLLEKYSNTINQIEQLIKGDKKQKQYEQEEIKIVKKDKKDRNIWHYETVRLADRISKIKDISEEIISSFSIDYLENKSQKTSFTPKATEKTLKNLETIEKYFAGVNGEEVAPVKKDQNQTSPKMNFLTKLGFKPRTAIVTGKEALQQMASSEKRIDAIRIAIHTIENVELKTSPKFSRTLSELNRLREQEEEKLRKAQEEFAKSDFNLVESAVHEVEAKQKKEKAKESYASLYALYLKITDPKEKAEIEEQLNGIEMRESLTEDDVDYAKLAGKEQRYREQENAWLKEEEKNRKKQQRINNSIAATAKQKQIKEEIEKEMMNWTPENYALLHKSGDLDLAAYEREYQKEFERRFQARLNHISGMPFSQAQAEFDRVMEDRNNKKISPNSNAVRR